MRVILIPDDTSSGRTFSLSTFQVRLIALLSLIFFGILFALASLSGLWAYNSSQQANAQRLQTHQSFVAKPSGSPAATTQTDQVDSIQPSATSPTPTAVMSEEAAPVAAEAAESESTAGLADEQKPEAPSQLVSASLQPQRTLPGRLNQALTKVLAAAGRTQTETTALDPALMRDVQKLRDQLAAQNHQLAVLRDAANQTMSSLGVRVGSLQAHIARLNSLGERLTQTAGLSGGEFDFNVEPAVGGAAAALPRDQVQTSALQASSSDVSTSMTHEIQKLENQLKHSDDQLAVLENLLRGRRLKQQSQPGGWPADAGFVSSNYGERQDPFTGVLSFHKGMDIAAEAGTAVKAAASGLVTHAGNKGDFGHVVEISHGNGYITRYAHNSALHVKSGDFVVKGERIAAMGSSGRSTGSHLHFEVIENGQAVDPRKYLESQ